MLVGYWPTKPTIGRGHESGSLEEDTEIRVLTLRSIASAKTLQYTKV